MSRYRAPQKPGSNYITEEGMQALKNELEFLWRKKRPEVTQAVSEAAALGDRSENAEYIYGKKQLGEIDRRVRYLRKRIESLQVVKQPPNFQDRIYFGAWVELSKDDGERCCYRIVGPDEIDLKKFCISMDSPMAKALLGRCLGERITLELPAGVSEWLIEQIRYDTS